MEKFTFFWNYTSPFSNHHISKFHDDNNMEFNCVEQYMMYRKAILFNDINTANKIMKETYPPKLKKLGREVLNFNSAKWDKAKKGIVYQGCYYKFTQDENLKKALLLTKGTTLVEASPYDDIWGIKLSAEDPRAQDRRTWRGQNLLGEILTSLRDDLE